MKPEEMLAWGIGWLADEFTDEAPEIVYRRGQASVPIPAVKCSKLMRTTDSRGNVKTERTERDFKFKVSALVLNGGITKPQSGDLIDATFGTTVERYELMPVGNEPCFQSDPRNIWYRVHCKFRKVV